MQKCKFGHPHVLGDRCRTCAKIYASEYHKKHRAKILVDMLKYRTRRKEYIREQRRRHYLVHKDEINSRSIAWIKKNKEWVNAYRRKNRIKVKARDAVNNAIRHGHIIKGPCQNCGDKNTHGHHENYSKPLDVIWLCPPCHSARHRRLVPLHQLYTQSKI